MRARVTAQAHVTAPPPSRLGTTACLIASLGLPSLGLGTACGSGLSLEVELVSPCNQSPLESLEFLRLQLHGTGLDEGLSVTHRISEGRSRELAVPLVDDFRLVATGHRALADGLPGEFPAAWGTSEVVNLTEATDPVRLRVPLSRVESFHRTTDYASAPSQCTTLSTPSAGASATHLPGTGTVLVVGGDGSDGLRAELERFDTASGRFENVGVMTGSGRAHHTATHLGAGEVLIAGGESDVDGARVSVRTTWFAKLRPARQGGVQLSEGPLMQSERSGQTGVTLADGRVLLIGGRRLAADGSVTPLGSIELFDPSESTFTTPRNGEGEPAELIHPREGHHATLLPSGFDVLVTGGSSGGEPVPTFELIRVLGPNVSVSPMEAPSDIGALGHMAVAVPAGVMLAGGAHHRPAVGSGVRPSPSRRVEVWALDSEGLGLRLVCHGALIHGRSAGASANIGQQILFVGGRGDDGLPRSDAEIAELSVVSTDQDTSGSTTQAPLCFSRLRERPMAEARESAIAVALEAGDPLLLLGGYGRDASSTRIALSTAELYTPRP